MGRISSPWDGSRLINLLPECISGVIGLKETVPESAP
ncbi:MAG: hypothetical protein ACD_25C00008G0001 [uncultured bacterium]|nr:MAG: hypothetical protein ACD_25C00008G0001 [uncultured bacterium]